MHIETSQTGNTYPPEPECQVNSGDCTFQPVSYLCHECGRKLCENCAVGIRHQPRMLKYRGVGRETNERVEMHCADCARTHSYNTTILAAGGGGALVGLALLGISNGSAALIVLGLILLAVGGYLLYNEYKLKTELSAESLTT
jgi:hypothetical protein